MLIGLYADVHFSINSSILLGKSGTLSGKLLSLVNSFEWMYKLFEEESVDAIVNLGDLVDGTTLRSEEITAISKSLGFKKDDGVIEYHVLGNHEMLTSDGMINSINFIEQFPNRKVITKPSVVDGFAFIPYGKYENGDFDHLKSDIAFTHIDIFGADTGGWKLKSGLDPSYLTQVFKLVVNGHIHNASWVIKDRILNLGSISGHNFSSKSTNWHPSVGILDTDTMKIKIIENPNSIRFLVIDETELSSVVNKLSNLSEDHKYVLQLRVPSNLVEEVSDILNKKENVLARRVTVKMSKGTSSAVEQREEIDRVTTLEGGFRKLIMYLEEQESLPYEIDDILDVVSELEEGKVRCDG